MAWDPKQTCLCNCRMCNCCVWQAVWLTQDYGMRLRWSECSLGGTVLGITDTRKGCSCKRSHALLTWALG